MSPKLSRSFKFIPIRHIGGADATLAFWARNLLNEKTVNFAQSLVTVISGDYERARTVGVDLNIEF